MFERANSIFAIQQGIRQIGGNAMSLAALPNRSLHSDATAFCHLLHRALWISVLHPKSTLAVPPVSFVVRRPMNRWLSIAAYTCEVASTRSEGVDFQVRQFEFESEHQVEAFLRSEPPQEYMNGEGELVRWTLARIYSIEPFQPFMHGDELIGFISSAKAIHDDLA